MNTVQKIVTGDLEKTFDRYLGGVLREQRVHCGISQETLAKALKKSLTLVQKYERGEARIATGRLRSMALLLQTSPAILIDAAEAAMALPQQPENLPALSLPTPATLRIAYALQDLDPATRKALGVLLHLNAPDQIAFNAQEAS